MSLNLYRMVCGKYYTAKVLAIEALAVDAQK